MSRRIPTTLLAVVIGWCEGGAGWARAEGRKAPLFNNLGDHHHPISTDSGPAQRFFDQGLTLVYGFNHAEAIRSFQEAARLDPDCAMPHWGIALAYGPNINAPMAEKAVPKAYAALQEALALAPSASARERAYIHALAERYAAEPVEDRGELDRAYADAMRAVAKQDPDDLDAATLFAEALMDTMPWDYWTKEGTPRPETKEVLAALEHVLNRDPDHPGANHYYIHAVEASPDPEWGLAAAHRLRDLVPGAGHLTHMPSHIYLRLGYYHEASLANERAITADESYIAQCRAQGFYPVLYYSHNMHFLAYTAALEGRSERSLAAAHHVAQHLADQDLKALPFVQWIRATPLFVLARFGRWDEILGRPAPPQDTRFERAMWHYARGMACAGKRQTGEAAAELAALEAIAHGEGIKELEVWDLPGETLTRLAHTLLAAELQGARGNGSEQIRGLREAVRVQDALPYMEPPSWYFPIRQGLGAALLAAGRTAEAEAVYREDLERRPRNGWSLYGLLQCLRAQGRTRDATRVHEQFREAWKHADVTLTASCF